LCEELLPKGRRRGTHAAAVDIYSPTDVYRALRGASSGFLFRFFASFSNLSTKRHTFTYTSLYICIYTHTHTHIYIHARARARVLPVLFYKCQWILPKIIPVQIQLYTHTHTHTHTPLVMYIGLLLYKSTPFLQAIWTRYCPFGVLTTPVAITPEF